MMIETVTSYLDGKKLTDDLGCATKIADEALRAT